MALGSLLSDHAADVYVIHRPAPRPANLPPYGPLRLHGAVSITSIPDRQEIRGSVGQVVDLFHRGVTHRIEVRNLARPVRPGQLAEEMALAILAGDQAAARALADHLAEDVVRAANGVVTYDRLEAEVCELRAELADATRRLAAAQAELAAVTAELGPGTDDDNDYYGTV